MKQNSIQCMLHVIIIAEYNYIDHMIVRYMLYAG